MPAWHAILGVVEEVGELSHAYLKREQGIRGTREQHDASIVDAVGDIVLFLSGFCSVEGIDLMDCIEKSWEEVSRRDWVSNKGDGSARKKAAAVGGAVPAAGQGRRGAKQKPGHKARRPARERRQRRA